MSRPHASIVYMSTPNRFRICLVAMFWLLSRAAIAQSPVATDDDITLHNGGQMFDIASFLLGNDVLTTGDSVQVVLLSPPVNGTLTRVGDSQFLYQANQGFVGFDSFSYRLQTLPVQHLVFDPSLSVLQFDASVKTPIGEDSDTEEVPIVGTLDIDIGPDPAAIDSVHLLGIDIRNQNSHGLRFDYGELITIGTLRINVGAEAIRLFSSAVGPAVEAIGLLRSFDQTGNVIGADVLATLEGSGLLIGQVPTDPQQLTTETELDLGGSVLHSSGNLVVLMSIDAGWTFDLDGNEVGLQISGSMQARGSFTPRQESNEATVTIDVTDVTEMVSTDRDPAMPGWSIDVYPNPVKDRVTVRWVQGSLSPSAQHVVVDVYDVLGRMITSYSRSGIPGNEMTIHLDASNWSEGLYFVRIRQGDTNVVKSLVRN